MAKKEYPKYSHTKFVYVRRKKDGAILDMSEYDWFESTANKDDFEFLGYVGQAANTEIEPPATVIPPVDKKPKYICPICGTEYPSKEKLDAHKKDPKAHQPNA